MSIYTRELEYALKAAYEAGECLRREFHEGFRRDVDHQADEIIHACLTAEFPEYGYRSEELGLKAEPRDTGCHLWLVDPQDGTSAAKKGFRGAAVSIALLRSGKPVLGVVHVYAAPDDRGDTFWWAEHLSTVIRNNRPAARTWPSGVSSALTALVSQDADQKADANAELVAPMRYRTVPGIAYRLALVAAGDGDAAITLNRPTGWDMAAGHALLLGAGGDLFDVEGKPVSYSATGSVRNRSDSVFFGGHSGLIAPLVQRDWKRVFAPANVRASARLCYLVPGKTVSDAAVLNRAQGCLLGQVAGDSLGSLVEFQSPSSIIRRYGEGPSVLEDGGTWGTIAGQPTDDSELALALARSLVACGDYDPDDVAKAYVRWYDSAPFDIGGTTSRALSAASRALRAGRPPAPAANEAADGESQANGALMRISPLGIFDAGSRHSRAFILGRIDASLTHPNPVCRDASGVMAAVISHAIRNGGTPREVYRFALELVQSQNVADSVRAAIERASELPPDCVSRHRGWVLVALQNAFYELLQSQNAEEGIRRTVRRGGDTDTNAAIAGALLGAVHGRDSIPAQWIDRVTSCRPLPVCPGVLHPRPPEYWPVDAFALAERLLVAGRMVGEAAPPLMPHWLAG
ncbi:MAG: inositol monophosphatase family protein [Rhodospirillales bacterium]